MRSGIRRENSYNSLRVRFRTFSIGHIHIAPDRAFQGRVVISFMGYNSKPDVILAVSAAYLQSFMGYNSKPDVILAVSAADLQSFMGCNRKPDVIPVVYEIF